jgi:hypothetical protein
MLAKNIEGFKKNKITSYLVCSQILLKSSCASLPLWLHNK